MDPLTHEPLPSFSQGESCRRAISEVTADVSEDLGGRSRPHIAAYTTFAFVTIAATLLGLRMWSLFAVSDVQAAVRFEIRLAEDKPAPGLQEAKVSGTDRVVYLHGEAIATNADIADRERN